MTLPDLAFQIVYGRLAWAIVLLSVLLAVLSALLPAARRPGRRMLGAAAAGIALLMALPGSLSPAWGLGLAFQYPSGLLVGCCLLGLHARWRREPVPVMMPVSLAAPLAIAGAALYLDAMGLLAQGYYYAAFGAVGAPLLALLGVAGCALAIARGQQTGQVRRQAVVLLGALLLYTLLRLPTGNLWDAVIDPLLWAWAVVALVRHGLRRHARSKRRGEAEPGLAPELQPADLQPLFAAGGIEHLSSSKEQVSGKQ